MFVKFYICQNQQCAKYILVTLLAKNVFILSGFCPKKAPKFVLTASYVLRPSCVRKSLIGYLVFFGTLLEKAYTNLPMQMSGLMQFGAEF